MSKNQTREMPDVAQTTQPSHRGTLDWVGMKGIALPLTIADENLGELQANALVQTFVNVCNPEVKGIHMSRLYLLLTEFAESQVLTLASLRKFIIDKLASHKDISDQACLNIAFDAVLKRDALKSQYSGWKDYPTEIKASFDSENVVIEIGLKVPYSSTCPCSAALSRQLLQEAFLQDFEGKENISPETVSNWLRSDRGSVATPHSQRSYANVWVKLDDSLDELPLQQLINSVEDALQTPVQTAVKREDEQEFARLNGANLMFCEDAARRLQAKLNSESFIKDFWLQVDHQESLHAHDAVAIATKGVDGGYRPLLKR